jgi:5-formyltetrahydrofolate cyclo-ligase
MNKQEIRKLYLQKRKELSPEDFYKRSQKIVENFLSYSSLEGINSIHIFLPIEKQREVDIWPLINYLQNNHHDIKIIISKSDFETMEMSNFILNEKTVLQPNKVGILEPEAGIIVENESIDMAIIPLIAFDKTGHRVGYGKGFYDRFLSKCRPDSIKVGVSLEPPVENIPDINENDFRLDFCVTPDEVYNFI